MCTHLIHDLVDYFCYGSLNSFHLHIEIGRNHILFFHFIYQCRFSTQMFINKNLILRKHQKKKPKQNNKQIFIYEKLNDL